MNAKAGCFMVVPCSLLTRSSQSLNVVDMDPEAFTPDGGRPPKRHVPLERRHAPGDFLGGMPIFGNTSLCLSAVKKRGSLRARH
jgi:hypothetical protein